MTWWNNDWGYRKKITLKTSTYLSGDVTNDHVIYAKQVAADSDFWGHVAAAGEDVRFVAADDTTALKYYFQRFDHTNDLMDAWVKVTDTFTSAADIFVYMYYGNAGASDAQDVTNTLTNYLAVYHSDEGTGTTVSDKKAAYNATASNASIWSDTAKTGTHSLDCAGSYYASQATLLDTTPSNLTIGLWFCPNQNFGGVGTPGRYIFYKTNVDSPCNWFFCYMQANTGKLITCVGYGGTENSIAGTQTNWTSGTWYHLLFTWNTTSGLEHYINGASDASNGTLTTLMGNGTATDFFWNAHSTGFIINAKSDEQKVMSVGITDDEAALLYRSENSDLQSYGTEEAKPAAGGPTMPMMKYW